MNKKGCGVKFLGIVSIIVAGHLFCMDEHKKSIEDMSSQIILATNKEQEKKLSKTLSTLKAELKHVKKKDEEIHCFRKKDEEIRCFRLFVYNLVSNELRSAPRKVLALKESGKTSSWYIDDMRLDAEGKHVVWSGRYGRNNGRDKRSTVGLTHLFAVDTDRNLIRQGSIGVTTERCDNVVSLFGKTNSALFAFFSNGMQSKKEYGLVRRCKSFCDDEKKYSIVSQYYNVGFGAGDMGAGDFGFDDNVLAFSRDSTLYYHKRTDDYPNVENSTISFDTDYGAIRDIQFSPKNSIVSVLHTEGNGVSLYKALSSKLSRLEVKEGELREFVISGDSKAYITISVLPNDACTIVNVYDAKDCSLKVTCKVPGILYNDFTATRKCYFSEHDEWFVVPVVNNGRLATVLIDSGSWEVAQTIIHGKERNKHLFKMAGVYGTFIRNKKKKVYIFDIRNSSSFENKKVDEIDLNYIPRFAFISPQGYIVTASTEGEQPNVEVYKYQ